MNLNLDIDLLRTFHAVARLGQFRAAAEHVHRSPAAVSMHIQRLEDIAGGRLLERDNQSVSLTPLGQRLLAGTTTLLHAHDRVLSELHGKSLVGRIKFGVPDEYAAHVIRDILPMFTASWPNVVLEVTTSPSLVLRDQIARGRLHLALSVRPIARRPDPQALATTTPVWVGALSIAQPLSEPIPLAMHAAHCPYAEAMTASLDQANLAWRVVVSSPASLVVETAVESGLGVSLVDRSRVSAKMRVLDGLPTIPGHEVMLLRSARAQADAAADQLERAIRSSFRL